MNTETQSQKVAGIGGDQSILNRAMNFAAEGSRPWPARNASRVWLWVAALLLRLLAFNSFSAEPVAKTNAPAPAIPLRDFKLSGDLTDDRASFTLTAIATVENARGGFLDLLSGTIALSGVTPNPKWRVRVEQGRFILAFDRSGEFPIQIKFNAAVRQNNGWNSVNFHVAPSTLQPIVLHGLAADTQFQFAGAARPERVGNDFVSHLPSDGTVAFSWKTARKEEEGKLFFAAEMVSQISVSPGLMRQIALLDFKVMQGELTRATLLLRGPGEVTRVQGDQVLAWNVEPVSGSADRRLVVQLNQAQKDQFALQVQMQTPLGAFPQTADTMQLRPEGATRFTGSFRIVNEGAVRLEVVQASGLSQISPEQFPESDLTRSVLRVTGSQRFAYRFSGGDFALQIQADQILPELSVSEIIVYHHGANELSIEGEIELDVREAPLRELLLYVPKGYALARLTASGMNDYFLREPADQSDAELRVVYGQPVSGRQVIQIRLERNKPLGEATWPLPRLGVVKARSVRGNIGVSADNGFRLTPDRTQALTEVATAFFPRKVAGLQAAFRINEPSWQGTVRVERLPQTVQADGFHLFSIGEGIAYGSSVMNYLISGAPVSAFRVELSDEYFNVEFTGKDIRNWQKTTNGYLVQLHSPVSGAFTLLATYERPFKAQGETLAFTGARPLDAQTEQGYTLVVSAYQFQVKAANVSAGLLPLETAEVPAEYRLFFDAPILAAYRYTSRPFNLQLALSPLAQGESLSQVVDRASLVTQISKEGQVVTTVRYLVKNRGNPNFRLTLPEGTQLWSATVNDAVVAPVKDGNANLIPLPQGIDPNAVLKLDLKLAAKSSNPERVKVASPIVSAPVMLAEWKLMADPGQRLVYRSGSLTPMGGVVDGSGFAQMARVFSRNEQGRPVTLLFAALALVGLAMVVWRGTIREGVYKFSVRHLSGAALGFGACALAALALAQLAAVADQDRSFAPVDVTFLAPVQQANSALTVEVSNIPAQASARGFIGHAWPALFAPLVWIFGWSRRPGGLKTLARLLGWIFLAWAALLWPNGAPWFLAMIGAFLLLHMVIPGLRRLRQLPSRPKSPPPSSTASGEASSAIAILIGTLVWFNPGGTSARAAGAPSGTQAPAASVLAESVTQEIRVEDRFALATAKIHWQALKGQTLPVLFEPAVLTRIIHPTKAIKLVQATVNSRRAHLLIAQENGMFDIEVQYQLQVTNRNAESGLTLPTQSGLINQVHLAVANLDVDMFSPQAVSVQRDEFGKSSSATLMLSPAADTWIGWRPRSRDLRREKAVFYAEISQLYAPSAGVIEGAHVVSIRPAQGELGELIFTVPTGATITDVTEPSPKPESRNLKSAVALWRFDPDARKLRVTLNPPQSRMFALVIRSQVATGPLPFEQTVGLLSVDGAAGQIGLFGVATGNEVQLDSVAAAAFSPINLEDFSTEVAASLAVQIPGLTVRRAFRYSDAGGTALLKASAVEPDVRVVTQDTLSLGEDRIELAATASVDITRAGIFRLSFVLPAGFDVESISGAALSHWTELKTEAGRVITLNLRGKTAGQQQFSINLAGPGVRVANAWKVPQVILREAGKQQGSLVVVPEQGMQLQAAASDGLSQLDPQRAGLRQKGVLAFRVLQTPWSLSLNIEQVEPWIQVTSLQHATVTEAQVKIAANLQYQIENTGLKAFHVYLPTNAESVRFQGEQLGDFRADVGAVTNGLQLWEVKMQRRVIGQHLLRVTYQTLMPEQASSVILRGVQSAGVNLQRGFLTVQSGGRLQVRVESTPPALQATEWQSIPRALQQNLPAVAANLAYRLVEFSFQLELKLDRHEAAKLLPARVNQITLTSVISDAGVMLTRARLEMLPGDKRLLHLTLPKDAQFWFAFVNQSGVWPWREQDHILIPLEQQSRAGQAISVEVFFTSRIGKAGTGTLDLELLAPKFDLPLENIVWRVCLNEKWQVTRWSGNLQLQQQEIAPRSGVMDFQVYLQNEASLRRAKSQEAEQMLVAGNTALEQGDPQQARRAFQIAFGLSAHDNAFNEDARVQLHNLKLQQALVGLNVRQSTVAADPGGFGGRFRDLRGGRDGAYTQKDAKQIIDSNTADDNSAFMRLAERIIQQQDAAVSSPAAIRASIPEQGHLLTFHRAVVVDPWVDLMVKIEAKVVTPASWGVRGLILGGTFLIFIVLAWMGRSFRFRDESDPA